MEEELARARAAIRRAMSSDQRNQLLISNNNNNNYSYASSIYRNPRAFYQYVSLPVCPPSHIYY